MNRRSFISPTTLLFMLLWLGLMIGGRSRFFQDPGTFWHTSVGQRIVKDGFFDRDPYTFTFAEQEWIPHQWLGELVMAGAHAIGGFDTLLLLACTALALLWTWLGHLLMRSGLHPVLSFVLVALGIAASSGHFHVRPHLATMVGFAVLFVQLLKFEAGKLRLARLGWLIPLTWVWANFHGGVLGGLATFALAIAGWSLAGMFGWKSPIRCIRDLLALLAILGACVGVVFLNPYGARLPETWLFIYRMESLPQLIQEHARLDPRDPNAAMIIVLGLLHAGLLMTIAPARPRVVWFLPLVWLGMTFLRVRHAPLFAVSALIVLADLFPATSLARHWWMTGSDLFRPPAEPERKTSWRDRLVLGLLPVLLVCSSLLLQATRTAVPALGHGWARHDPTIWPVEWLEELKARQHERPEGTRIFNEYAWGGFLIYHTPGFRVFVDDRCELFGDAWLTRFLQSRATGPADFIEEMERRYGPFDYALVEAAPGSGFREVFERNQAEWAPVPNSAAGKAILFRRVK